MKKSETILFSMMALLLPLFVLWHSTETAAAFDEARQRGVPAQSWAGADPAAMAIASRSVPAEDGDRPDLIPGLILDSVQNRRR